jgi:hypothetical protein
MPGRAAPLVLGCVACWGVLVNDLPTRDGGLGANLAGGGHAWNRIR